MPEKYFVPCVCNFQGALEFEKESPHDLKRAENGIICAVKGCAKPPNRGDSEEYLA